MLIHVEEYGKYQELNFLVWKGTKVLELQISTNNEIENSLRTHLANHCKCTKGLRCLENWLPEKSLVYKI